MINELMNTLLIGTILALVLIIYRLDQNIEKLKYEVERMKIENNNVMLGLGISCRALGASGTIEIDFNNIKNNTGIQDEK